MCSNAHVKCNNHVNCNNHVKIYDKTGVNLGACDTINCYVPKIEVIDIWYGETELDKWYLEGPGKSIWYLIWGPFLYFQKSWFLAATLLYMWHVTHFLGFSCWRVTMPLNMLLLSRKAYRMTFLSVKGHHWGCKM